MNCPYPACNQALTVSNPQVCACEEKNSVRACFKCDMVCPGNASFCRACGSAFPAKPLRLSRHSSAVGPNFLFIPGTFCAPPVAHDGFLWVLTIEGTLYRLSPQASAKPVAWCQIPSDYAGLNRYIATNIHAPGNAIQGPVMLSIEPAGVYAISLIKRDTFSLIQPPKSGEIVANTTIQESPYFRGVAASTDFLCFLFRSSDGGGTRLVIRYFHPDRAAEEPMRLEGRQFLGPIVSEDAVAMCNEDEVHIFCTRDQTKHSFSLPSGFAPYFQRPSRRVNVPPGQIPLAIHKGNGGWSAWIGGEYQQQPTVLEVQFEQGHYEPHSLNEGACICSMVGTGIAINQVSHVDFLGIAKPAGRFSALQPGMPLAFDGVSSCYFQKTDSPENNELAFWAGSGNPLTLSFKDKYCNEDCCCGLHRLENDLLVSYMQVPAPGSLSRGVKFAHWSIQ